jgi:hydroxymethylpyrimidine/phosphomethylpyrimidine kinase
LLKGGHNKDNKGRDHLFTTEGKVFPYKSKQISETGKHGSGCVLSSAIAANLANGLSLQRAGLKGKDYVTKFLMSNKTLLGYHKI